MAVRTTIEQTDGLYFITFTCQGWLPLFEITDSYDPVYKRTVTLYSRVLQQHWLGVETRGTI